MAENASSGAEGRLAARADGFRSVRESTRTLRDGLRWRRKKRLLEPRKDGGFRRVNSNLKGTTKQAPQGSLPTPFGKRGGGAAKTQKQTRYHGPRNRRQSRKGLCGRINKLIAHALTGFDITQPNRATGWRNLPNPIPSHNGLSFLNLKQSPTLISSAHAMAWARPLDVINVR